jgi:hypothetical protein
MKWVFKEALFNIRADEQIATGAWEQKRNFSGEKGEMILLLGKIGKEWFFTYRGIIKQIRVRQLPYDIKGYNITIELMEYYSDQKPLDDYIYSMRRIRSFQEPIRHYKRKYSRLFDHEYDAIVNDKIIVNRTIFGTIVNALHVDHQEAFLQYLAEVNPRLLSTETNVSEALSILYEYLDFAIIQPANYLKASAEILQDLMPEEYKTIGFAYEADALEKSLPNNYYNLDRQAVHIEQAIKLLPIEEIQGKSQVRSEYGNDSESRFFKNMPLPIQLKKS